MIRENLLSISSWPEAQSTEKLAAELWAQSLSWLLGSSALKCYVAWGPGWAWG